jgi:hypothetical protein
LVCGRYAGVVEWKNAVVLWVNADGGGYDNLFLDGTPAAGGTHPRPANPALNTPRGRTMLYLIRLVELLTRPGL